MIERRRQRQAQGKSAVAHKRAASARARYAAIDLGTNNCRLLIAEPTAEGFQVVDAFSRIVRLGEGLARDGQLSEPAMARALAALKICADKLKKHNIAEVRAVATQACRQALNGGQFLERVRRVTGIDLQIIPQAEEARLALTGCAPLLQPHIPNALVFDIGGGSTEVIWLRGGQASGKESADSRSMGVAAWYSMPIGVVGLSERHGGAHIAPGAYERMVADVAATLGDVANWPDGMDAASAGRIQMIGTSGTVTTLAGVYQNLRRYDRRRVDGCYLGFDTVRTVSERIARMSYESRLSHPCIGRHRADLVVPGCAILEAICRTWPVGLLRVADRGLREGMLLQMMGHVGAHGLAVPDFAPSVHAAAVQPQSARTSGQTA